MIRIEEANEGEKEGRVANLSPATREPKKGVREGERERKKEREREREDDRNEGETER